MWAKCCEIFSWKQEKGKSVNQQSDKIVDSSLHQLNNKPTRVSKPQSLYTQQKRQKHGAMSAKKPTINNNKKFQKKIQQRVAKPIDKVNQYKTLLLLFRERKSSEKGVFLRDYVLQNSQVQIDNQDNKDKLSISIIQALTIISKGAISQESFLSALVESLHRANEICNLQDLPSNKKSKKQQESQSLQKPRMQSAQDTLFTTSFSVNLLSLLVEILMNPLHIFKLWGLTVDSKSISQEKKHRKRSPPKMMHREPSSDQSEDKSPQMKLPSCKICFDQIKLSFKAPLQGCRHVLHFECIQKYIESKINSNIIQIKCPIQQCKSYLTPNDIEKYLDNDMITRYYKVSLNKYVEQNNDVTSWCPTAGCPVVFQYSNRIKKYSCPLCKKNYCLLCRTEFHTGMTCMEYRKNKKSTQLDKAFMSFAKGLKLKQCPKCKFWVQKNQGCNQITCRCGIKFCYVCGGLGCGHFKCNNSNKITA